MTNKQKKHYNELLESLNKAKKYMNDPKIAYSKKEPHIPRLQKLMRDMHDIAKEFKLTEEDMENGFKNIRVI